MAKEHVQELGDFVDEGVSHELAGAGHAGIVGDHELGAIDVISGSEFFLQIVGLYDHRSELEAVERPAVKTLSLVFEEDGAGRIQLDNESDYRENRRKQRQNNERQHDIRETFAATGV